MHEASKMKASKVRKKRRTTNMKVVVERARTDCAEHTVRIVQLKGDIHKLQRKWDFLEHRNNLADWWYSMLSN